MNASLTPASPESAARMPRLSWPPPGLEGAQGEIWLIIGEFALGVIIFALPLLLAIATDQHFASLGPFGQSWWIPMATSLLAMVVLGVATRRLSRLFRKAAAAARLGYSIGTIATVVVDFNKDSGFILQGARSFAGLTPSERRTLLAMRITSAVCYLCAAMWIPAGLAIAVLLAATDSIGPGGVWILTLMPALTFILTATVARFTEYFALRRSRRTNATSAADDLSQDATEWTQNLAIVADSAAVASNTVVKPRTLGLAAVAVIIPGILVLFPVAAVLTSAAVGPVLASIAVPRVGKTMEKMAVADAMRGYRLPFDSSVTPTAAGIAFVNLSNIGHAPEKSPLIKPPVERYPEWPKPPAGWDITHAAASDVFAEVRKGISPEVRTYLEQLAANPAQKEFGILGRARSADISGAYLVLPLPDTLSISAIPIERFGGVREAAYTHIASAALAFENGKNDDAERMIREVISVGFILLDDGNTLIENLIGNVFISMGAKSLEEFYRADGRTADADALVARQEGAERAAAIATTFAAVNPGLDAQIAQLPEVVSNRAAMRGLRFESFARFASLAPCINLHNVVFGPGEDYDEWVASTRASFVRYPADAELFAIAKAGYFGSRGKPSRHCVPSGKIIKVIRNTF